MADLWTHPGGPGCCCLLTKMLMKAAKVCLFSEAWETLSRKATVQSLAAASVSQSDARKCPGGGDRPLPL